MTSSEHVTRPRRDGHPNNQIYVMNRRITFSMVTVMGACPCYYTEPQFGENLKSRSVVGHFPITGLLIIWVTFSETQTIFIFGEALVVI